MKPNTIIADGTEVYTSQIFQAADEYIDSLNDPEDIYDISVFTGLIKHIYLTCRFDKDMLLENIDILDNLWNCYTTLVYKYKQKPSIETFAVMTGLSRDCFYGWRDGSRRAKSPEYAYTIKRWILECESVRIAGASRGSVGDIFLLKAKHEYRETAPVAQIEPQQRTQTLDDIARRYGITDATGNADVDTEPLQPPVADF